MEPSKKRELLADYIAGRISRDELQEALRGATFTVVFDDDGEYRHKGERLTAADVERLSEKSTILFVEVVNPSPPVTSEDDLPDDI